MPRTFYVQLKAILKPARVLATAVEKNAGLLILKNEHGEQVEQFRLEDVVGWWDREDN